MPRPRHEDDDRDEPRARTSAPPLVLILALFAGFLMLVVLAGGVGAYVLVSRARHAEEVARADAAGATQAQRSSGGVADRQGLGPGGQGVEVLDGGNGNPIVNEFSANPIAAEEKWFGKRVDLWNGIGKIDRDRDGWFVVFQHCDITAHIAAGEEKIFSTLRPGMTVEVEVTLTHFTMTGRGGIIPYLWGQDARLVAIENERYLKSGKNDPKKTYAPDDFDRLVIGKTPAEIIAAVGPPGRALDDLGGSPRRWHYAKIVISPNVLKPVWVWFKDGKAERVAHAPGGF